MMRRVTRHLGALIHADSAVAAVELGLLSPVFMLFMTLLIDLGFAYHAKLQLVSGTAAAAQYAFAYGQQLTASTVPAFLTNVSSVATTTASLTPSPTVTVKLNNAADGSNFGNYYCVSGTAPATASYTSTGSSSYTCGNNVTSGKFVYIGLSTTTTTVFFPQSLIASIITINDAAIVRLQ